MNFNIPACSLLAFLVLISSCLKNKDSTGKGPKSQMSITSYIVNGASIDIFLDDSKLTTTPLTFGKSISSASGGYLSYGSGIHNLKISSANDVITDNTFSFETGKNYSLFVYDTLQNNKVKAWLVTDNLEVVDTIAKSRFLQFIPATDSLTIYLIKDTIGFAIGDTYIGNKSSLGTESDFFVLMPPGNYKVILLRRGNVIFEQASVSLLAGKLYSFIARGIINGTGEYKEGISVIQHN